MLDSFKTIFRQLIDAQQIETFRYLYHDFTLEERLIGLIGINPYIPHAVSPNIGNLWLFCIKGAEGHTLFSPG